MLDLHEIVVRPVLLSEEQKFQKLMATHHYLGALPKIGETLWYVAIRQDKRVALMTFLRRLGNVPHEING